VTEGKTIIFLSKNHTQQEIPKIFTSHYNVTECLHDHKVKINEWF
jgi:hypothetical protein